MSTQFVIADAPVLNRKALSALVAAQPDCEIVGEGGTVGETLAVCASTPHDVLLLDAHLPGSDEAPVSPVSRVLEASPDTRIIVLVPDVGQRCAALLPGRRPVTDEARFPCCARADCAGHHLVAGASCAVPREAGPARLFWAIRRVAAGRPCFGAAPMARMIDCVARHRVVVAPGLSVRERQVAALVSTGLCNKEIAVELEVGIAAVKKHIGHILAKLGIEDRLQLGLLVERNPDLVGSATRREREPRHGPRPSRLRS